jgi:hypothetical protein
MKSDINASNSQLPISIRTSDAGWLKTLAGAYRDNTNVVLIDDANTGIDPAGQTLLQMGVQARMSKREIMGVAIACGMSFAGAAMIGLAIIDPEPTSKLSLLVGGGIALALTGGLTSVQILTRKRPPRIVVGIGRFELDWS